MGGAVNEEQCFAWQIGIVGLTVNYTILHWNGATWDTEASGTLNEIGADGLYEIKFTPDAAGFWLALGNYVLNTVRTDFGMIHFISWGVEQANYAILSSLVFGSSALKDLIDLVQAEVANLDGASMRGTDGAALAASWTAGLATILGNFTALRIGYLDQLDFDLQAAIAAIQAEVDNLDGDSMRGTDGAATAAVWTNALATILGNFTALRIGYLDELNFDLQGALNALDGLLDAIIADIGVFPTANYTTLAAYVEDIRIRLTAIVGDTNEIQQSLADGGFTNLLIDSILTDIDLLKSDIANLTEKILELTAGYHREKIYPYNGLGGLVDCGNEAWGPTVVIIPIDGVTADYGWDTGAILDYSIVGFNLVSSANPSIQCIIQHLRVVKSTVQVLDVDSGLGEVPADRIYVPLTGDFLVDDWIWVVDDDTPTGEIIQIESIDTDNYLDMDGDLTALYSVAQNAKVYLARRVTANGEYRATWSGFSASSDKDLIYDNLHAPRKMLAGDGLISRGRSVEVGLPEVLVSVVYDDS